jgi:hypothetical protein
MPDAIFILINNFTFFHKIFQSFFHIIKSKSSHRRGPATRKIGNPECFFHKKRIEIKKNASIFNPFLITIRALEVSSILPVCKIKKER